MKNMRLMKTSILTGLILGTASTLAILLIFANMTNSLGSAAFAQGNQSQSQPQQQNQTGGGQAGQQGQNQTGGGQAGQQGQNQTQQQQNQTGGNQTGGAQNQTQKGPLEQLGETLGGIFGGGK
jgi:hypothetical protein